jgi:hypothetical protein
VSAVAVASTTQFREAVQALLAAEYEIEFVGGRLDPPQENRAIGCVWHEGKRQWARDGNESQAFYRIRVYPLFRVNQGETNQPINVEALEDQAERLERTLGPVLVTLAAGAGHYLFVVSEVSIDQDNQYVEAQITAWQRNLAAIGG